MSFTLLLVSTPESQKSEPEIGLYPAKCIQCGDVCLFVRSTPSTWSTETVIDRSLCNACGKCAEVCNAKAIEVLGHQMTVAQLIAEVKKDDIIFKYSHGGVTISGGEPLFKTDSL